MLDAENFSDLRQKLIGTQNDDMSCYARSILLFYVFGI